MRIKKLELIKRNGIIFTMSSLILMIICLIAGLVNLTLKNFSDGIFFIIIGLAFYWLHKSWLKFTLKIIEQEKIK